MITLDTQGAAAFVQAKEVAQIKPQIEAAHRLLYSGMGPGSEYIGWLDWPSRYDTSERVRISRAASKIRKDSDILVVIGIGGSYLGARAAIEMLTHSFRDLLRKRERKAPIVFFAGNQLSSDYLADLLEILQGKKVSVNVISKSGTTTEPAIAFRVLKQWMEKQYGPEEARSRIYVTTDRSRGALRNLADKEGYTTFVVPDDIGGRFSVLTPVGLLPIAAAGIDIREMLRGAKDARKNWKKPDPETNPCMAYAAWRNILLRKGYQTEILVNYEPGLHYFTEWWKQLFGESEGKDGRGLFPAGVDNTTDLHSMGQYIQDGRRFLFETVLQVKNARRSLLVPEDPENGDGLNFVAGMDLHVINERAMQATALAHADGGVPNLRITIPERSPYVFGQLVYFFELACAISGYLLAINPFDQPGVENYKKNMYALLGKPGFEDLREALTARLDRDGV
jgi:glucose-6-phosphate isomerase